MKRTAVCKRTLKHICIIGGLLAALLCGACGNQASAGGAAGAGAAGNAGGTEAAAESAGPAKAEETQDPAAQLEEQLKLAWNFLSEGNYKEAVLAFTAVLDIDPKNGDAYRGRAESYMGLAGEAGTGGSAEDYANYLSLAAEDYEQAALYLPDQPDARHSAQLDLCAGLLKSAAAEYEAGSYKTCFEQMRRAAMTGGFNYLIWNPEYKSLREDCRESVRSSGDQDLVLSWIGMLIDITEQSQLTEEDWTCDRASFSLGGLKSMIVGQYSTCYLTIDTVKAIDSPIVDLVRRHEEYQENGNGIEILYYGSIALGDLETAARMYPKMVEARCFASNMDYVFGDGGYTLQYVTGGGTTNAETEFDIYSRQLWLKNTFTETGAVSHNEYEYEGNGPRRIRSVRVTTQASGEDGSETDYIYENGRLVQEQWHTWKRGTGNRYDFNWTRSYEYSGNSVTITEENNSGNGETEISTKELVYSELR